jgi:hypothetical protein
MSGNCRQTFQKDPCHTEYVTYTKINVCIKKRRVWILGLGSVIHSTIHQAFQIHFNNGSIFCAFSA